MVFKPKSALHKSLMKASKGNKGKRSMHRNALPHLQMQHFAPIILSVLYKDQIECKLEVVTFVVLKLHLSSSCSDGCRHRPEMRDRFTKSLPDLFLFL